MCFCTDTYMKLSIESFGKEIRSRAYNTLVNCMLCGPTSYNEVTVFRVQVKTMICLN